MALAVRNAATLKPEIRLAQALSEYEAILQLSEKAEFRSLRSGRPPGVSQVMELTAAIDRNNSQRKSRRCFGPRFTNVLESVQQFSTIVDVIISGSQSLIASAIWGTLKMTLQLTSSFASYFDNLSALFMRIGRSCPRYQEYALLYPKSTRLQGGLCDYFCTMINVCKKAVLFIRKPFIAQLSSAILNPFRTEFGPLENQLSALADLVRDEASLASQQELNVETRESSAFRTLFSSRASEEMQKAGKLKTQRKKLRFLHICSAFNHQTAWKRARKAGTSSWLLDRPEYKQWVGDSSSNVLWCTGKLGSGKTVCAASLMQHTTVAYPEAFIAYFLCTFDEAESLKAKVIIGSLARQLLSNLDAAAFDTIEESDPGTLTEDDITAALLSILPSHTHKHFVLVDGLDECSDQEVAKVLKCLDKLLLSVHCLHIFCSSRPDTYVNHRAILKPQYKVSLPEENPEIEQYIESALEEYLEAGKLTVGDPNIILAIRDALLLGSQGMFLWVVFQLESICMELTDEKILHALQSLPKDLPETFERILYKTESEKATDRAICRNIFALVATAQRPLTLDEMREAISIVPGETVWDPQKQINDIMKALAGCGSLVVVDEEDFSVRFVHHSVRQYVASVPQNTDIARYHVSSSEADLIMGNICVTYLNLGIFDRELANISDRKMPRPQEITSSIVENTMPPTPVSKLAVKLLRNRRAANVDLEVRFREIADEMKASQARSPEKHRFLAYAAEFWLFHTKKFEPSQKILYPLWLRLVDARVAVATIPWAPLHWSHLHREFVSWFVKHDHGALLYITIQRLFDVSSEDEAYPMAPRWTELNDTIFAKDMDFNVEARFYGSVLTLPDILCDIMKLSYLIEKGVDVNATDWNGRRPIELAAKLGLEHAVKLLLGQENIMMDGKLSITQSLLFTAIMEGWIDVLKSLLSLKNVYINEELANSWPSRARGCTPLTAAIEEGQTKVVELLLKRKDIDINMRDAKGTTALIQATHHNELRVVELLTAMEILDVNLADPLGRTALMHAVGCNDKIIVVLLTRGDTDFNAKDSLGKTALALAVQYGHAEVVELFLNRKEVAVNASDKHGRTALALAAQYGHAEIVELFLNRKEVAVNASDKHGRTALALAAQFGRTEIVELFLGRADIDTEVKNSSGLTAFEAVLPLSKTAPDQRKKQLAGEIVKVFREHKARQLLLRSPVGLRNTR